MGVIASRQPSTKAGRIVAAGFVLLAMVVLGGVGCDLSGRKTPPPGPEVRDPALRWRTSLPTGFIVDPADRPHTGVRPTYLAPQPTATAFSITSTTALPQQGDAPPLASVLVFQHASGTPIDWYHPLLVQPSTNSSMTRTTLDGIQFWTFQDMLAFAPVTYYVATTPDGWAIEVQVSGEFPGRTELVTSLVRNFEALR